MVLATAIEALAYAGLPPPAPSGRPHVILITIDGFPARMFGDPKVSMPNLRALAATGASAEALIASNPAMTWSNHTTLVTGVLPRTHSVLANGMFVGAASGGPVRVEKERTAQEMVAAPSLFDRLHDTGHTTAAINWPCTKAAVSVDDNFPDTPGALDHTTVRLRRELIGNGVLPTENQEDFFRLDEPRHDEIWTQAACYLIRTRMPDFMAIHLLNTDEIQHAYGPESLASYSAAALADRYLGDIIAAVEAAGQRENTTFIVVSDHGFATAKWVLRPNVLLRDVGLLEGSGARKVVRARVQAYTMGGSAFIYFLDRAMPEEEKDKVLELLVRQKGVAAVIKPDRFASLGLPDAGQGGTGDALLLAKAGYGIVNDVAGEGFVAPATIDTNIGFHGYLAQSLEMHALFVANGRGIKRGVRLGEARNVDIAPTILHLFNQAAVKSDGRILTEILTIP